jgi:hypothetical protein
MSTIPAMIGGRARGIWTTSAATEAARPLERASTYASGTPNKVMRPNEIVAHTRDTHNAGNSPGTPKPRDGADRKRTAKAASGSPRYRTTRLPSHATGLLSGLAGTTTAC